MDTITEAKLYQIIGELYVSRLILERKLRDYERITKEMQLEISNLRNEDKNG